MYITYSRQKRIKTNAVWCCYICKASMKEFQGKKETKTNTSNKHLAYTSVAVKIRHRNVSNFEVPNLNKNIGG